MEVDAREWIEEAIKQCERAAAKHLHVMLRNDDYEIIVTNAQDAPLVRELGLALACGYGKEEDSCAR